MLCGFAAGSSQCVLLHCAADQQECGVLLQALSHSGGQDICRSSVCHLNSTALSLISASSQLLTPHPPFVEVAAGTHQTDSNRLCKKLLDKFTDNKSMVLTVLNTFRSVDQSLTRPEVRLLVVFGKLVSACILCVQPQFKSLPCTPCFWHPVASM